MPEQIKLASDKQIITNQAARIAVLESKLYQIKDARKTLQLAEGVRLETAARIMAGFLAGGYVATEPENDAARAVRYADALIHKLKDMGELGSVDSE